MGLPSDITVGMLRAEGQQPLWGLLTFEAIVYHGFQVLRMFSDKRFGMSTRCYAIDDYYNQPYTINNGRNSAG